jgi:hypothetical protein
MDVDPDLYSILYLIFPIAQNPVSSTLLNRPSLHQTSLEVLCSKLRSNFGLF